MTQGTGQLKAARPAQMAREMLGMALGQIQDISNQAIDVEDVTATIARAVGALFAVQSSSPEEPAHVAGVCQAMDYLRATLELMQDVQGEDAALENATRIIAKTLAILYPVSQVQAKQSVSIQAPPAVMGNELPHDARRSVQRVSIEADIGFQSESNFFTGFTEDISSGGLFISTFDIRPIGSILNVNFTLPNGHLVSTDGIVRWIREYNDTEENSVPGMGVQFENLDPNDKQAITQFLSQREPLFYDE